MSGTREITISPTTRIEGHGRVTIVLDDQGNVSDAFFQATEIRGFEYFTRGMEAEKLPFIISRICGVCSTAHMMASVKAIENVYGAEVTETARKLRELLLMAQIISNHSLVFYFLILPDFWFPAKEDPSRRNIFQIMRENPEVGRKALRLRTFGTDILDRVGGREVHIVSLIPGGLTKPLGDRDRRTLFDKAKEACEITREALSLGKELFEKNWAELSSLGDCCRTSYMALTNNDLLEFQQGTVRLIDVDGSSLADFGEQDYMAHIREEAFPWSYSSFAYYGALGWPKGIVQVGPMARMNVAKSISTDLANEELKFFKGRFGSPAHEAILFDYARLIDLLYACERSAELLEDETLTGNSVRVPVKATAGEGVGIVEAPRGTLAHRYALSGTGKLTEMRLIIPTQVNNAAINMSVKAVASKFIRKGEIGEGLLNGVEMLVRAYDPCIKCATRMVNNNLTVEIKDLGGRLIRVLNQCP